MGPKFVIFGGNLFDLIMNKLIMHTKLHMEANNCLKWQKQKKLQIIVIWKI